MDDEPATPPAVDDLLTALFPPGAPPTVAFDLLRRVGVAPDGSYDHWDTLRRRTPPDGLTPEQWWLGVKLARGYIYRDLPLHDADGRVLRLAMTDPALATVHELDRLPPPEDLVGGDADRRHHLAYALAEEAIRSAQLDGADTAVPAARDLLESGRAPTTPGERMIAATSAAIELLGAATRGPLTTATVQALHRTLAAESVTADALRPDQIAALCRFANGGDGDDRFLHPVVRAVLVHFWVAAVRPFGDTSGRAARALFSWSMRAQGYPWVGYLSVSRVLRQRPADYRRAFRYVATDDGDTSYFVLFHLDVVGRALAQLRAYVEQQATIVHEVDALIPAGEDFNSRQLALLGDALRRPVGRYTFKSHARSHRVSFQSARTDLLDLQDRRLLVRRKVGREFVFGPAPDLAQRLRSGSGG